MTGSLTVAKRQRPGIFSVCVANRAAVSGMERKVLRDDSFPVCRRTYQAAITSVLRKVRRAIRFRDTWSSAGKM